MLDIDKAVPVTCPAWRYHWDELPIGGRITPGETVRPSALRLMVRAANQRYAPKCFRLSRWAGRWRIQRVA